MQTLASHCRGAARWRIGALFLALVFCAAPALAQFTLVTGTVTDPNGVPYALGTIVPLLTTSATPTFTATGLLYFPPSQASGLDGTGHFLVRIADNTQLSPGGTTWNFKVCSAVGTVQPAFGTGPQCFTLASPITISGSSQDIGAALRAVAPALTLPFSGGGAPCNITNTSVQYDNSGAFGCADLTFATGSPLNAFTSLLSAWTLGSTFATSSNLGFTGLLTVQSFPQLSGTAGGAIGAANLIATDQSSGNASGTVSSITGATIQANGSVSNTGQTAAVPNIFGVNVFAKAPFVANVTNEYGGFFKTTTGSGTATVTNKDTVYGVSNGVSGTVTNDATFFADSPAGFTNVAATATHHYGFFIANQTVGNQNLDPWGIFENNTSEKNQLGVTAATRVNQNASGNWAGTCTFAAGTTCVCTYSSTTAACPTSGVSFTATPVVQITPVNPGAITFTLTSTNNTGFTITASGSNSLVVNWSAFGNPN